MQILFLNSKGKWVDVTPMALMVRWSGDYQQIARTLDVSILSSPSDNSVPAIECELGTKAQLIEGKYVLFYGMIVSRTKSTGGNAIDITCFDRGFQLKRNNILKTFINKKPEEIATALVSEVAIELDIEIGSIAKTGISICVIACSTPPEGRSRWTMQIIADEHMRLEVIDYITDSTICETMKKMRLSRG